MLNQVTSKAQTSPAIKRLPSKRFVAVILLMVCLFDFTCSQFTCVDGCYSCTRSTGKCTECYPYYTTREVNTTLGGVTCEDTVNAKVAELNAANSGLPKPFLITIIYGSWVVLFIVIVCCCNGLFKEEFPMPEDLVQQGPNPAMNHLNQMAKA